MKKRLFKTTIIKIGLAVLVFSLVLLLANLYIKYQELKKNEDNISQTVKSEWDSYTNPVYGFKISYPRLLFASEPQEKGRYLYFVHFLENRYSKGDGVAVGVSGSSLQNELEEIKKSMKKDENALLIGEVELRIAGERGVLLNYAPTDPDKGERRSIALVGKGKYSYSISTTPEQIADVVSSFRFVTSSEDAIYDCGGRTKYPCPAGYGCELDERKPESLGKCVRL